MLLLIRVKTLAVSHQLFFERLLAKTGIVDTLLFVVQVVIEGAYTDHEKLVHVGGGDG